MGRRLVTLSALVLVAVVATSANASAPRPGGKILFASNRGDNVLNAEIYSVPLAGSPRRNLTRNQGWDGKPVFSPDGSRIAFWSERLVGGVPLISLYVMRSDGSDLWRVTPPEILRNSVHLPPATWSPDGRRLAFAAKSSSHRFEPESLWVVNVDGSGLAEVAANGNAPVWAPVGTSITFTSEFRDDVVRVRIEIVDAETRQRRRLAQGASYSPAWSPDGGSIAFLVPQPGSSNGNLYRISAGGGLGPAARAHRLQRTALVARWAHTPVCARLRIEQRDLQHCRRRRGGGSASTGLCSLKAIRRPSGAHAGSITWGAGYDRDIDW